MIGWRCHRLPRAARLRSWRETRMLAVDFEATSAHPRKAAPLSVGWVPVDEGRVRLAGAGYSLIRPTGALALASIPIHQLLPGDVADAPSASEVAEALRDALDGRVLVAHGARLELALLERLGLPAHRARTIDTMQLARRLDARDSAGGAPQLTLPGVAARYGVPLHHAHHALSDAVATAMVLLVAATRLERSGSGRTDDLLRLGRAR